MRLGAVLLASVALCAELPRVRVDTALPAVTGSTATVAADCSDLQAKINAAALGDAIVIPAGAVCTGNYVLRNKATGAGWITIRTSQVAALPAQGIRVNPSHSALMPKIQTPNTDSAIRTEASAHHYRLIGLEVTVRPDTALTYDAVALGDGSSAQNSLALVPEYLVIDRCYIHGNPHQQVKRGIALNSGATAIIDSYLSEWHLAGQDSQAINGWNGPGPYLIRNNYLEGAGENFMLGGAPVFITDLVPSDIEILGNTFYKPLSWRIGDPTYAGDNFSIKNLFELKSAQRVLVEGNTFEHCWVAAQGGGAIVFTIRNTGGANPWNTVADVTFQRNVVRSATGAVTITGHDDDGTGTGARITVEHNLFDDIRGQTKWGTGNGSYRLYSVFNGALDITLSHNTAIHEGSVLYVDGTAPERLTFASNIQAHNTYGIQHLETVIDAVVTANVLAGGSPAGYPAGNYFPATLANVGFTNQTGGNFRLLSTSDYRGLGPNVALLPLIEGVTVRATDRAAVLSWTVTPGLKAATCTVYLDGTAISGTPRSAGNVRTIVLDSLAASTTYAYRAQCGGAEARGSFTTSAALTGTRAVSITRVAGVATADFSWGYAYDSATDTITSPTTAALTCEVNVPCTATFTVDKGKPVYYRFGAGDVQVL